MIRIAITGGAGYLGSVLLPALQSFRGRIDILDIRPPKVPLPSRCRYLPFDLSDPSLIKEAIPDYDFIVHLAGLVGFPACAKSPELAVKNNLTSTEHLMRFKRKDTPLLLASTVNNYGGLNALVDERTPVGGASIYSETKIQAERRVMDCPRSIVFRFSSSFGVSPSMRDDLLVHDFVWRAVRKERLSLYEADTYRQFIHVEDMVASLLFALNHPAKMAGEIFNVGSSELELTKKELARAIQEFIPLAFDCDHSQSDPEKRHFRVSFKKIESVGFKAQASLAKTLPQLVSYYVEKARELAGISAPSPAAHAP